MGGLGTKRYRSNVTSTCRVMSFTSALAKSAGGHCGVLAVHMHKKIEMRVILAGFIILHLQILRLFAECNFLSFRFTLEYLANPGFGAPAPGEFTKAGLP